MGRATKWLLLDDDEIHNKVSPRHHHVDYHDDDDDGVHDDGDDEEEKDVVPNLSAKLTSPRPKSNASPSKMSHRDRSPGKDSLTSSGGGGGGGDSSASATESGGEDSALSQGSTASRRELKSRYIEQVASRKQNEETLNQLQN